MVWRRFYEVETFSAVYGVETFLRCGEFRCKELLTGFEHFSRIGEYVRSLMFYLFCHRAIQSVMDLSFSVCVLKVLNWNIGWHLWFGYNIVMAINISINKTLVFIIQSKIIHVTVFSTKRISILLMFLHSYKCAQIKINSDR